MINPEKVKFRDSHLRLMEDAKAIGDLDLAIMYAQVVIRTNWELIGENAVELVRQRNALLR